MAETTAETPVVEKRRRGVHHRDPRLRRSTPPSPSPPASATRSRPPAPGRRKNAIARVRIVPGSGKWKINGRTLEGYFPNKVHQQEVNEPFKVLELDDRYDVVARISGGGISGQAGALRLGVARALNEADVDNNRGPLKKAGFLTRDARAVERKKAGLKKARKAHAVQQALIRRRSAAAPLSGWRTPRWHYRCPVRRRGVPALDVTGSRRIPGRLRRLVVRAQRTRRTPVGRLFGTDGVRGVANADLTAELALGLSVAAAHVLAEAGVRSKGHRPVAVVGRDPRASGEFLEAAVVAGLASAGVDVLRVGVLPTPAVAYLTGSLGADLGVMLSASHNPMPDNGIKFFARGGHKLADELEDRIEAPYREHSAGRAVGRGRPAPAWAGSRDYDEGFDNYVAHLVGVLPNRLDGLKIVIDGAHGAASRVSPEAFAPRRRRGHHHRHRPRRPEHQRRLRLDPPGAAAGGRRRARRRPGRRPRRRRRPLPGRGRGRRRDRRRPDPGRPGARHEEAGAAAQGHRRRPPSCPTSASSWPWSARASSCCRRRSATATCWRR